MVRWNMAYKGSIPKSRQANCAYCQGIVDRMGERTWQRGTGWFPKRKAAKGSHSATNVTFLDDFACAECIDKLKHGIPVGQMSLLDLPGWHKGVR